MVLFNSKAKPFHGFNCILVHSDAFVICHAKIIFCSHFILIGSFTIPLRCFNRVFGYASTDGTPELRGASWTAPVLWRFHFGPAKPASANEGARRSRRFTLRLPARQKISNDFLNPSVEAG